jgi:DNA-binding transcriptional LysR family regulator
MLDPARLEVFVAVAREGGFSAAARALDRSQPAVSQLVSALEDDLGQKLFIRDGRRIALTAAGEVLLEHADRILDDIQRAEAEVAHATIRRVALGTTDTLACYLLPPVLGEFRRRYPGVDLRIETRPSPVIAERVAARALDLGIITLPIKTSLPTEVLAPHEDVVITPRDHPLANRKRIRMEELAEHPLVLLDRTTATRMFVESELGVAPRVVMETTSVEVLLKLVELGFGASVVPAIAARGNVQRIALIGVRTRRSVGIVSGRSRGAEALIEIARARLS